jgi:hypothetical protein
LRALWDKKYYLKPYYASEPLHSPVLRMLHLKDYLPDMGYRSGDGSGHSPESQRLMASGNPALNNQASIGRLDSAMPESQRLSHPQSGMPHPFAAQMKLDRGTSKMAAAKRVKLKAAREAGRWAAAYGVATTLSAREMERQANGRAEAQRLLAVRAPLGSGAEKGQGRGTRVQGKLLADDEVPPSSPAGVARWWRRRTTVRKPDAGDIWQSHTRKLRRAEEHIAAKAHLLDLCFGTLKQEPAPTIVGWKPVGTVHVSSGKALHERKKEEACRILRAAGSSDWLDQSKQ